MPKGAYERLSRRDSSEIRRIMTTLRPKRRSSLGFPELEPRYPSVTAHLRFVNPPEPWDSTVALALMAAVQVALDADAATKSLGKATEFPRALRPLVKACVEAWTKQDLGGVRAACGAMSEKLREAKT